MNEYDIEEALRRTAYHELPNLRRGAEVLSGLKDWTNGCSDGWPYWQKPKRASARLQRLIEDAKLYQARPVDITEAQLKAAITPIKSFLTRENVDPDIKARIVG